MGEDSSKLLSELDEKKREEKIKEKSKDAIIEDIKKISEESSTRLIFKGEKPEYVNRVKKTVENYVKQYPSK